MNYKHREGALKYLQDRDYIMTVHQNEGVFRHLSFSQAQSSDGHFHITTWPGFLCISGDMGCFVFARTPDMFEFFRGGFNPGYWSEKVNADSTFRKHKYFDVETFKEWLLEQKTEYIEENGESEEINDLFKHVRYISDEYEAVEFIRNFDSDLIQFDEPSWPEEFSFHYLFACHAIPYAISEFDRLCPTS